MPQILLRCQLQLFSYYFSTATLAPSALTGIETNQLSLHALRLSHLGRNGYDCCHCFDDAATKRRQQKQQTHQTTLKQHLLPDHILIHQSSEIRLTQFPTEPHLNPGTKSNHTCMFQGFSAIWFQCHLFGTKNCVFWLGSSILTKSFFTCNLRDKFVQRSKRLRRCQALCTFSQWALVMSKIGLTSCNSSTRSHLGMHS